MQSKPGQQPEDEPRRDRLLDQSIFDLDPHPPLGEDEHAFDLEQDLAEGSSVALLEPDAMADTQVGFTLGAAPSPLADAFCSGCGRTLQIGEPRYQRADGVICLACDDAQYAAAGFIGKGFAAPAVIVTAPVRRRTGHWKIVAAVAAAVALIGGTTATVIHINRPDPVLLQKQADERQDEAAKRYYEQMVAVASAHAAVKEYPYAIAKIREAKALLAAHTDWVPNVSASQLAAMESGYFDKLQEQSRIRAEAEAFAAAVDNADIHTPAAPTPQPQDPTATTASRGIAGDRSAEPTAAAPAPNAVPAEGASNTPASPPPAASAVASAQSSSKPQSTVEIAPVTAKPQAIETTGDLESTTIGGVQRAQQASRSLPPQKFDKLRSAPQHPVTADDYADLGSNLLVNHDLAGAMKAYAAAGKIDPRNQRAAVGQILVVYFRGNTESAITSLETLNAGKPTRLTSQNLASMYQSTNILRSARMMYDYLRKTDLLDPEAFDYYVYSMWQAQFVNHLKTQWFWRIAGFYDIYENQLRLAHTGGNGGPELRLWGHDWISADDYRAKMDALGEAHAQFNQVDAQVENRVNENKMYKEAIADAQFNLEAGGHPFNVESKRLVSGASVAKALDPAVRREVADSIAAARHKLYEAQRGMNAVAPPMPTSIPILVP